MDRSRARFRSSSFEVGPDAYPLPMSLSPIVAACPRCHEPLPLQANARPSAPDAPVDPAPHAGLECRKCGYASSGLGGIFMLLPRPGDHVAAWRRQLGLLQAQAQRTQAELQSHEKAIVADANAHHRVRALRKGVADQIAEVTSIMTPVLGEPLPPDEHTGLPRGIAEHIHFLYRDWGWPSGDADENKKSLQAIEATLTRDRPLGRTLVLGAGASRLAYDLHAHLGACPTVVVDIDPFLFVIAEAVVRGRGVALTEATLNVQDLSHLPHTWTLSAPRGPVDESELVFLLADGVSPPFPQAAFDTVVTPWFIDQVPPDLPGFLSNVRRLLAPGGRWINHGPLIYPASVPMGRRRSREEVFDIARGARLPIRNWSSEARAHLHSPLNQRGKLEWVLTWDATAE